MNGAKSKTFVSPLQWYKWNVDEDRAKNLLKLWVQSHKYTGSVSRAKSNILISPLQRCIRTLDEHVAKRNCPKSCVQSCQWTGSVSKEKDLYVSISML